MIDLKPCERVSYVHYCLGGAHDGHWVPSSHCYESLTIDGTEYVRCSEPQQCEGPEGLQVINCSGDYTEPVFFRVDMKPAAGDRGQQ